MTDLQTVDSSLIFCDAKSVKVIFISLPARACSDAAAPYLPVHNLDTRAENGFLRLHVCRLYTVVYCAFTACS